MRDLLTYTLYKKDGKKSISCACLDKYHYQFHAQPLALLGLLSLWVHMGCRPNKPMIKLGMSRSLATLADEHKRNV
jgi:hypothetical protein